MSCGAAAASANGDDFMGVVLVVTDKAKIARLRGEIRELDGKLSTVNRLISIAQPAFALGDPVPLPPAAASTATKSAPAAAVEPAERAVVPSA